MTLRKSTNARKPSEKSLKTYEVRIKTGRKIETFKIEGQYTTYFPIPISADAVVDRQDALWAVMGDEGCPQFEVLLSNLVSCKVIPCKKPTSTATLASVEGLPNDRSEQNQS